MTRATEIALRQAIWESINAYVSVCGGDPKACDCCGERAKIRGKARDRIEIAIGLLIDRVAT